MKKAHRIIFCERVQAGAITVGRRAVGGDRLRGDRWVQRHRSERPDLADSCLSHCSIFVQFSELDQEAVNGKNRPDPVTLDRLCDWRLSDRKPVVQLRRSVRLLTASQYLEQGHHVLFTVSGIDGLLEEAGDEIGNLRVDVGVNALLLDTL